MELKRAALESFNGTFKVFTFLVTNIWNWSLMPAMGIDVLERNSTTQTWTKGWGGGGGGEGGGVFHKWLKKKRKGMGRKVLFFFSLTISFLFCYRFFLRKKCCYFLYDNTLNNQLNGNTHRNVFSWLYPFLFSLVKSFFKGCQKFKQVPSDAHLRSLHTGYYQDNGK